MGRVDLRLRLTAPSPWCLTAGDVLTMTVHKSGHSNRLAKVYGVVYGIPAIKQRRVLWRSDRVKVDKN